MTLDRIWFDFCIVLSWYCDTFRKLRDKSSKIKPADNIISLITWKLKTTSSIHNGKLDIGLCKFWSSGCHIWCVLVFEVGIYQTNYTIQKTYGYYWCELCAYLISNLICYLHPEQGRRKVWKYGGASITYLVGIIYPPPWLRYQVVSPGPGTKTPFFVFWVSVNSNP